MNSIHLLNLWLLYLLAYAVAFPLQIWANHKRGEPFDDPEFLYGDRKIFLFAMLWLFGGLALSLFVPLNFSILFYIGLFLFIVGLVIVGITYASFANQRGLATVGIHRFSRNPGYVGWAIVIFSLALMGWSLSIWSILFALYFLLTLVYFHWTVLLEEAFLMKKYGVSYKDYISKTARYFGFPGKAVPEEK